MSWLRIDDAFTHHPKIIRLTRSERWTWLEVLCYVARFGTRGLVPSNVGEVVRTATPAFLNHCLELKLLERAHGDYYVHDWDDYNGRDSQVLKTERQRRWREKASTSPSTEASTSTSTEASTPASTRAQARARVPQPRTEVAKATSGERGKDELWEALVGELGTPSTKTERGRYNAALKELREIGASPPDVLARCRFYRRRWPDIALTPQALTGNWTQLVPPPTVATQPIEEVVDMPELTGEQQAANLERVRELSDLLGKGASA